MNKYKYISKKYPMAVVEMFKTLRQLIYDNTTGDLEETLWAK